MRYKAKARTRDDRARFSLSPSDGKRVTVSWHEVPIPITFDLFKILSKIFMSLNERLTAAGWVWATMLDILDYFFTAAISNSRLRLPCPLFLELGRRLMVGVCAALVLHLCQSSADDLPVVAIRLPALRVNG